MPLETSNTENQSVTSWNEIESWITSRGQKMIFRGQSDDGWPITTNLERALAQASIPLVQALDVESALIRRFQREVHQYIPHLPKKENIPEWLALMQHHGAPTRLLDWSHSAFVGLFFASIDQQPGRASVVLALDWGWIDSQLSPPAKALFNQDRNLTNDGEFHALCNSTQGIAKLNSFRLIQRQSVQQGTFLIPADPRIKFEDSLCISLSKPGAPKLSKLTIPWLLRNTVVQELYRRNMNAATMFPGLDGYARSFLSMLPVDHMLKNEPVT